MIATATSPRFRRFTILTAGLFTTIALAAGCAAPGEDAFDSIPTTTAISADDHDADLAVLEEGNVEEALQQIVDDVEEDFGGTVSLAVEGDDSAHLAGSDGSEPAWSTIKVPIAIAALRDGAPEELVDSAIKESDNDAAYTLWQQVEWAEGSAQESIEALLNDFESNVEMEQAFGMSTWKVKDQARFASRLGCVPEFEYVYEAMQDIVDWQQWGLATLEGVHSKGGWGLDDTNGVYTSRQLGVMPVASQNDVPGGAIGVALSMSWDTWGQDSDAAEEAGYDSTEDLAAAALNEIALRMETVIEKALETGQLKAVDDCIKAEESAAEASRSKEAASPEESEEAESTDEPTATVSSTRNRGESDDAE